MNFRKGFILIALILAGSMLTGFINDSSSVIYMEAGAKASVQDNRSIILMNDFTNQERNRLLIEDIKSFGKQLAAKHKNPFDHLSKKEFENKVAALIEKVGQLTNTEIFVELNKITAAIGDAHTTINYWDGYQYPLKFAYFDGDIYVINADISLKDLLYARVVAVNGHEIAEVIKQLKTLIAYENESWVNAQLSQYLDVPVYLYGLRLIPNEEKTIFKFEQSGKRTVEKEINTLPYGKNPNYAITDMSGFPLYMQNSDKYYWHEYLTAEKILYFKYNACAEMKDQSFSDFNKNMFNALKDKPVKKIVIDLRQNSGGNSVIIKPFINSLKAFVNKNPDTKVYVAIDRNTFSSGVMAALDIQKAVPVILIGEPTGGSPNSYGEVRSFELPNSKLPVFYSTKYFIGTTDGANTVTPDILIKTSIEKYKNMKDAVMEYIIEN